MVRELLSWLGLFSQTTEGIKLLQKFKIINHLTYLIEANGYYDHVNQIILNSFEFSFDSPSRRMLRHWSTSNCSPLLTKSILEYCRLLHRSGLYDFYQWCLPFLMMQAAHKDRQVSATAFDVLEEACFDEDSLNQLLQQGGDNFL